MNIQPCGDIIDDLRQGKPIILVGNAASEGDAYLVMAAERASAESVNFMIRNAYGLVCLTLTAERCSLLGLDPMSSRDSGSSCSSRTNARAAAFTVSIEAAEGVSTGISAADRATTIKAAVARTAVAGDIVQPGHVFPLMASRAGVLNRAGHIEAGCDLAKLAGYEPAAVISQIMNADGTVACQADIAKLAAGHSLKIGSIDDLIHYRLSTEQTVERLSEQNVRTQYGPFRMVSYRDSIHRFSHLAFVHGDVSPQRPTIVRVCNLEPLRDVFGISIDGFQSWAIGSVLPRIAAANSGVLLLLENGQQKQDLLEQARLLSEREAAPFKQIQTDSAAHAIIGSGCQILRDLGVGKMRLMSREITYPGLAGYDLEVVEFLEP